MNATEVKKTLYTNMAKTKDSLLIGKFYAIIKLFSLFSGIFSCVLLIFCRSEHTIRCKLQMEVEIEVEIEKQGGQNDPLETVTETYPTHV